MSDDFFDKGYDAYEDGKGRENNPYDKQIEKEKWKEWDSGWERGEEDATLRMSEYGAGGADWPRYDFKMEVIVNRKRAKAAIGYEWIEECYYRAPAPYLGFITSNMNIALPIKTEKLKGNVD